MSTTGQQTVWCDLCEKQIRIVDMAPGEMSSVKYGSKEAVSVMHNESMYRLDLCPDCVRDSPIRELFHAAAERERVLVEGWTKKQR